MAIIELPKDAEGREIPLNTAFLYDNNGQAYEVRTYCCAVDEDMPDRKWEALLFSRGSAEIRSIRTTTLYLTPPDSWEKLEEDLDRAVENGDAGDESIFQSMACAYMNRDGEMCGDCKFWNKYVRNCTNQMLKDVVSRIRKLRGDD